MTLLIVTDIYYIMTLYYYNCHTKNLNPEIRRKPDLFWTSVSRKQNFRLGIFKQLRNEIWFLEPANRKWCVLIKSDWMTRAAWSRPAGVKLWATQKHNWLSCFCLFFVRFVFSVPCLSTPSLLIINNQRKFRPIRIENSA